MPRMLFEVVVIDYQIGVDAVDVDGELHENSRECPGLERVFTILCPLQSLLCPGIRWTVASLLQPHTLQKQRLCPLVEIQLENLFIKG